MKKISQQVLAKKGHSKVTGELGRSSAGPWQPGFFTVSGAGEFCEKRLGLFSDHQRFAAGYIKRRCVLSAPDANTGNALCAGVEAVRCAQSGGAGVSGGGEGATGE